MGGNVFKGTIPIEKKLIPLLYADLKQKLNLNNSKVVGSWKIKDFSSDVDIAIWDSDLPNFSNLQKNFEFRKIGGNYHLKYEFKNQFYQIDFFKCGSEKMADFFYMGKSKKSKYTADHRSKLLFDFLRELNPIKNNKKIILISMGLFEVSLNEKQREISRNLISNNPEYIINKYFKSLISIEEIKDFETLFYKIKKLGYFTNSLKERYVKSLNRMKKEIPIEIIN